MGNEYDLSFEPAMRVDVNSLICAMKRQGDTRTKYVEGIMKIKRRECTMLGLDKETENAEAYFAVLDYIEGQEDLYRYMHTFNPEDIGRKTGEKRSLDNVLDQLYENDKKRAKNKPVLPQKIPTCEEVARECRSSYFIDHLLDDMDYKMDEERAESLARVREKARIANQGKTPEEQEIETDLAVWDFCETTKGFRDLFEWLVKLKSFEKQ